MVDDGAAVVNGARRRSEDVPGTVGMLPEHLDASFEHGSRIQSFLGGLTVYVGSGQPVALQSSLSGGSGLWESGEEDGEVGTGFWRLWRSRSFGVGF